MPFKPFALLAGGAVVIVLAAGCSKNGAQSSQAAATGSPLVVATSVAASAAPLGDVSRGKTIFSANCASCHGATGREGGIGPSLTNEKSRKDFDQTVAWIHNPQPPMPKLWPSPLNDKDVADVAAYVQSL
ncbi:MAG TPA: cytochrome c [Candidatus Sulfotelmatobacter sp.]|nr:cytochrome c [Candidatus Sulfotelmatobacter sp.]